MSRSVEEIVDCPCGTRFKSTVHQVVNVTLDPPLMYQLLAGVLNTAVCPNCGRQTQSDQPFLYHDMARGLFAYVSSRNTADDDDRNLILEHLRLAYVSAVEEADRIMRRSSHSANVVRDKSGKEQGLPAAMEPDAPPMQVIFGTEALAMLVNSLLDAEDRLGKLALTANARTPDERARIMELANKLARQTGCECMLDDDPEEFTVWIYGPRSRISILAQALGKPVQ